VDERINRIIHALVPGRLTLPALQSADPALVKRLRARLREVKRFTNPDPETIRAIGEDIENAYDRNLRAGDYALQARYWQLRADELRWRRTRRGGTCEDPANGEKASDLPPELEARRAALVGDVLFNPARKPVEANRNGRFMSPGWLMEAIAKRSGLGIERLRPALKAQGSLQDRCSANIALIDAALAKGGGGREGGGVRT
jgi:hypothetical protein